VKPPWRAADPPGVLCRYGGSSSAINKQQQMLKQIQRSDAEVGSRSRIVCGIVLAVQILSRTPTAWHLGHQSVA
jgi:hypothetical protein